MTALGQRTGHSVQIFETSASGNKLKQLSPSAPVTGMVRSGCQKPAETFQTITGFGGFLYRVFRIPARSTPVKQPEKDPRSVFQCRRRSEYSLTRPISTTRFFLRPVCVRYGRRRYKSRTLQYCTRYNHLIPMIREAQQLSTDGFKIIASPGRRHRG